MRGSSQPRHPCRRSATHALPSAATAAAAAAAGDGDGDGDGDDGDGDGDGDGGGDEGCGGLSARGRSQWYSVTHGVMPPSASAVSRAR